MLRVLVFLVVSGVSIVSTTPARAATVTVESTGIGPGGLFFLKGFDSRLGTLERVSLEIVGAVLDKVATAQNLVEGNVPVPYGAPLLRDLSLKGIAGSDIATLASGLVLASTIVASGAGEVADAPPAPFHIALNFTATTDVTGFVSGSGLVLANAERADFVRGPVPLVFQLGSRTLPSDPRLTPVARDFAASALVFYTYTPAPPAVPLPAGAGLLVAGLATLPLLRRRSARRV